MSIWYLVLLGHKFFTDVNLAILQRYDV